MGRFSFWIILEYANVLEQHFPFCFQGFPSNVAEFLCLDPILRHRQEVFFPPPLLSVFFLLIARVNVSFHVRQPCTNVHV